MIKIFTLVLDLLQLKFNDSFLLAAEELIEKPDLRIFSFVDKWFVFFAFQEMLLGKISQEDFVALGDSFGNLYAYQNNPMYPKEALVYWLQSEANHYAHSLILFPKEEKQSLEKAIPSLESVLKKIKSQIFYV